MSGYLVTSPYGPLRYHHWSCDALWCTESGGDLGTDREDIRAQATARIEATGHYVTLIDGTTESLYPMATGAAS